MIASKMRHLTPEETLALQPSLSRLGACWHWTLSLGVSLVLIPFVFGGAVGALLQLFLGFGDTSYLVGLAIGYLLGLPVLFFLASMRSDLIRENESLRDRLDRGIVEVLTLDGVGRAWEVDGLEDFGPGLVLDLDDGSLAYIATADLLDHWSEEGQQCPGRKLTLERLEGSQALLSLRAEGTPFDVEPSSVLVADLPVDLMQTCVVFEGEQTQQVRNLLTASGSVDTHE